MGRPSQALWSPEALADLAIIWDYYHSAAGIGATERMLREIAHATEVVAKHPHSGRSREDIRPELRSLSVPPHILFYRIRHGRVEVVRVLDARRDVEDLFA